MDATVDGSEIPKYLYYNWLVQVLSPQEELYFTPIINLLSHFRPSNIFVFLNVHRPQKFRSHLTCLTTRFPTLIWPWLQISHAKD